MVRTSATTTTAVKLSSATRKSKRELNESMRMQSNSINCIAYASANNLIPSPLSMPSPLCVSWYSKYLLQHFSIFHFQRWRGTCHWEKLFRLHFFHSLSIFILFLENYTGHTHDTSSRGVTMNVKKRLIFLFQGFQCCQNFTHAGNKKKGGESSGSAGEEWINSTVNCECRHGMFKMF